MSQEITDLAIRIKGEIVSSNFEDFKAHALEKIDGMNYELLTDDDFAKAKQDIKDLDLTSKALKGAKEEMLKQLDDVYTLMGGIDEIIEAADNCRLGKSREVKKRDAEIKEKIIEDALGLIDHPKRERYRDPVAAGARGKRSFETMAKGANQAAKAVNEAILKTRAVLDEFENTHGRLLIPDRVDLELESVEVVGGKLNARLEKQRDEEEKARLKAEAEEARKQAEYEKAKATAEEAKAELKEPAPAPVTTPTPPTAPEPAPKVGTIPVGTAAKEAAQTAEEEMARFLATVEVAFAPVKAARAKLRHTENIRRAQRFATALGEAWTEFKKGGSQ